MAPHLLRDEWNQLVETFVDLPSISQEIYKKLEASYTSSKRAYHNFVHIGSLLQSAKTYQDLLHDYDALRFAIWFHDVVYDPLTKDNEEQSAEWAEQQLSRLLIADDTILKVKSLIKATAQHVKKEKEEEADTAFFLDFDLQILGSNAEIYSQYSKQIREEYSAIPDLLYKPGRKKVLQRFLDADRIFRTEAFYERYEKQARINLQMEITWLS